MKKVVILFSGTGSNLMRLIEVLPDAGITIAAAITNRPNAGGIEKAQQRNVPVEVIDHTHYQTREAFDAVLVDAIEQHAPDLVVLAGFMRILTPIFTESVRAINLHPSLLPKYKGAKAIERSFEGGDKVCGVSVHWVNSELDSGEVIAQERFTRTADMDLAAFESKIHAIEHDLLPKTVIALLNEE